MLKGLTIFIFSAMAGALVVAVIMVFPDFPMLDILIGVLLVAVVVAIAGAIANILWHTRQARRAEEDDLNWEFIALAEEARLELEQVLPLDPVDGTQKIVMAGTRGGFPLDVTILFSRGLQDADRDSVGVVMRLPKHSNLSLDISPVEEMHRWPEVEVPLVEDLGCYGRPVEKADDFLDILVDTGLFDADSPWDVRRVFLEGHDLEMNVRGKYAKKFLIPLLRSCAATAKRVPT